MYMYSTKSMYMYLMMYMYIMMYMYYIYTVLNPQCSAQAVCNLYDHAHLTCNIQFNTHISNNSCKIYKSIKHQMQYVYMK